VFYNKFFIRRVIELTPLHTGTLADFVSGLAVLFRGSNPLVVSIIRATPGKYSRNTVD